MKPTPPSLLENYAWLPIFVGLALVFVGVSMAVARFLAPHRPNVEKQAPYESGEQPLTSAQGVFKPKYYVIALIFLLFEVELVFLFPWVQVLPDAAQRAQYGVAWSRLALGEILVFLALLALGLAYVWKKGFLKWDIPTPTKLESPNTPPSQAYEAFNQSIQTGNGPSGSTRP